jgi:hypothetical protein
MAETFRFAADVLNETFHLVVKTPAEFGINLRVVIGGVRVFLRRFGMEGVRFHRPTILRIRLLTTSPGTA